MRSSRSKEGSPLPRRTKTTTKSHGYIKLQEGAAVAVPMPSRLPEPSTPKPSTPKPSKPSLCTRLSRSVMRVVRGCRVPFVYYSVGTVAYYLLEGWAPLDVVYFLTVTSTTVGYGDYSPATPLGKLFTCLYALIGITVVLGALSPLVEMLKGDWRERLLTCLGCAPVVDTNDPTLSMEQVNQLINYPRRYTMALLGPVFVLFSGVALHMAAISEAPMANASEVLLAAVDSIYWSVITMTTIG